MQKFNKNKALICLTHPALDNKPNKNKKTPFFQRKRVFFISYPELTLD